MSNSYEAWKRHNTKKQKYKNEKNESIHKTKNKDKISVELPVI